MPHYGRPNQHFVAKKKPVAGFVETYDMMALLEKAGFEVRYFDSMEWLQNVDGIDLLVGENIVSDKRHEDALKNFIEVPRFADSGRIVEIMVSGGAVEAPYFILGKTDLNEWARLRQAPAPWAELQCELIIL